MTEKKDFKALLDQWKNIRIPLVSPPSPNGMFDEITIEGLPLSFPIDNFETLLVHEFSESGKTLPSLVWFADVPTPDHNFTLKLVFEDPLNYEDLTPFLDQCIAQTLSSIDALSSLPAITYQMERNEAYFIACHIKNRPPPEPS